MIRSLLILLHYCAFTPSHAAHVVKRRQLNHPVSVASTNTVLNKNLRHSNEQQRRLSQPSQRIVILAGPHKTASSSIQSNLYTWTSTDPQVLPTWAWPVPDEILEFCDVTEGKGFYPLMESLRDGQGKSHQRPLFNKFSHQAVSNFYRDAMEKEWTNGSNLVIGTEALDFLGSNRTDATEHMFDKFLNILPLRKNHATRDGWGVLNDVTVVVKFRAPRVNHLISVFHQCCSEKQTFMDFLIALPGSRTTVNRMRVLDSFTLSEVFLKHGLNVILIDMSGIIKDGYDISTVVACDILKANCTETEEIITDDDDEKEEEKNTTPIVANVKHNNGNMGGVTDEQLDRIEKVLRKYDCNYQHVLEYEKLTVLYSYEMDLIMKDCPKTKEVGNIRSRQELAERLKDIAMNNDGVGDESYYNNTDVDET